jgi:hypothetical protein
MKAIPKLQLVLLPPVIYCGCHEVVGHFFYEPNMVRLNPQTYAANYNSLNQLDCGFAPQDTQAEGEAWYHSARCENGDTRYNVISFWDRSVDSRPGSHSTFLLLGDRSFDDSLAECRKAFPQVFARFKFEIKFRQYVQ